MTTMTAGTQFALNLASAHATPQKRTIDSLLGGAAHEKAGENADGPMRPTKLFPATQTKKN